MERREHTRFRAQDDAYAVLGGDFSHVGRVYDINLNGLAFTYLSDKIFDNTLTHVDIFLSNNGFYLSGVSCKIVYEGKEPISDSKGYSPYRCGLKFNGLEAEHEDKLAYFLNHHVIEQREESRGQRAEGQRAEGRGQRSEGREQRAKGRGQRSEGRGQRAESREQKTEGRGQRSEDPG